MEKLGILTPPAEEQLSPEKGGPPDGLVKVLVGFKQKPGPAEQELVKGVGGKIKYTYHLVPAIAASVPEVAIEALKKNPNITHVELDSMVYALLDGELDNSWGVKRIGAGIVHDSGNKGVGVKVAIIDSGIDYNHPDLNSNYQGGYDFVNDDSDPMDDNGHGTHVAGTVAALDDGIGVVGVAPEANLYALKVLSSGGSGSYSDVIAALQWCVDHKIQITNNSYGSSGDPGVIVKKAFDNAYFEGILHIAAAGNSGNSYGVGDNIIYPARYDSVIAVAATDKSDKRASWSSTGSDLELSAPGVAINSTLLGGGYIEMQGTSMACPHVVGTAALVWAKNPTWTNDAVRTKLQNTADDLGASGRDSLYGYGLVDADEAAGVETPLPGNIAGKVTEATSTGSAIAEATVVVEGTSLSATTNVNGEYTITNIVVGTYTVTASATGYIDDSQTANVLQGETTVVDFILTPATTPSNTMHVSSIKVLLKKVTVRPNKFYTAIATVNIVDADGSSVEGATVSGTWSGATSDTDSGVTDGIGQVSLQSDKVENPKRGTTFTFTVDSVTKEGWTYDSSKNTETSDSIKVP